MRTKIGHKLDKLRTKPGQILDMDKSWTKTGILTSATSTALAIFLGLKNRTIIAGALVLLVETFPMCDSGRGDAVSCDLSFNPDAPIKPGRKTKIVLHSGKHKILVKVFSQIKVNFSIRVKG